MYSTLSLNQEKRIQSDGLARKKQWEVYLQKKKEENKQATEKDILSDIVRKSAVDYTKIWEENGSNQTLLLKESPTLEDKEAAVSSKILQYLKYLQDESFRKAVDGEQSLLKGIEPVLAD